ncbi:peptidoglycan-binding protein [Streptomyces sp. NPDC048506]|uniref:peptidoglycan-binding protein n=1 Tax=Streptomyces sp. NPDC048506 TaxID=3155028 RepID=UPI00343E8959
MSRWKGLPETLDHRVRQLVVQLRRLKDHSGLSLASLAAKTAYSKSSWERYLNGKKLPPRDAVEALARVCGADATRLLVLHEVAAQAWESGRKEPEAREAPEAAGGPDAVGVDVGKGAGENAGEDVGQDVGRDAGEGDGTEAGTDAVAVGAAARVVGEGAGTAGGSRPRFGPLIALGALAVLVVAGVVLLVVRPWQHDAGVGAGSGHGTGITAAGRSVAPASTFAHRVGETFPCRVWRTGGVLTAGRSRTATAILGSGTTGWEVVEAQCLLNHQGFDPGPVDGIVGEHTMRAVKRLQTRAGLPADGIVGPDTWKALRR